MMKIRKATLDDLNEITKIEEVCFPKSEAASKESFRDRLTVFPEHFWLLEIDSKIITFINGMVTNNSTISDTMYENAGLHDPEGNYQAIFGVNTLPEYQKQGYARKLMEVVIKEAYNQGRKGCILTCKKELIHFYEKFGYQNMGLSKSIHGGAIWYDMKLEFKNE